MADRIGGERRGLLIGARIVSGVVAVGVAALVIGAVAFVPFPVVGSDPRSLTVEPAPADQVRVCPGAALRVGDESGANADQVFAIGAPSIDGEARSGDLERSRLTSADETAAASSAPELLRVAPADGALVGAAQSQDVDAPDFDGFTAANCTEPSSSIWLVGGAMTIGRSTALLIANPTEVPSRVSLEIFGEDGPVSAPGLTGIDVPPGGQRVVSLAGFAPGVASPVVHVTARGGSIVADLQQSIVRGLDAVGVETIGGGADPGEALVLPGVRIVDTVGTNRASALADWQDVGPAVRIAVPGEVAGRATVRVVPDGDAADGVTGASFELELEAGTVTEIPLDAGGEEPGDGVGGESSHGLQDGIYTVYIDADVAVVAGVRASTAVDSGEVPSPDTELVAPESDLAWFAAAPPLDGQTLVVVPQGPDPVLSIVNPTDGEVELELEDLRGGEPRLVVIPAGGSVALAVEPGSYLLAGAEGMSASVSFAAPGTLASFVLAPARPVADSLVVHPD
ncbi:DUF5719 family protein [Pseudolysinimonas sp.]|uniref:DUF5719 family protein n=1 Tax=Pseudolysinimonas sp. TaxID=2680009 RepID=UPI00378419B1